MAIIPINIATGSLQKEDIIIGIDLGTTNSLVAVVHPQTKKAIILKEIDNTSLVPSVVYFDKEGYAIVGNEAKTKIITEPENTIFSVKRLMGKSYQDMLHHQHIFSYQLIENVDNPNALVKIKVKDKFYTPIELSALILKELKKRAEHILKMSVSKAVITVPAYFNDTQRQATRDAGRLAGLDVVRIINEPTAASLSYGIGVQNNHNGQYIAVYDLGGGTFDISILKLTNGVFDVLATHGDTYLGGDDFDLAIYNYWIKQNNIPTPALQNKNFQQALRLKAEDAKKHLSNHHTFNDTLNDYTLSIDTHTFQHITQHLIDKTIQCMQDALKDAELKTDDINTVLMVGGATRIPSVKKAVSLFFKQNVNDDINPDEVVALGAAIQADMLSGNNTDVLLLDITPLSLGIETMGGLMDVLIPRNSKIPTKASRQYTTQKDGQSGIVVSVYQGERDLVKDNRKLASFVLTGIPAMPAGFPKVEITFFINADGILQVSAKELRSGVQQHIDIKPQSGLTDEEVENMLLSSLENSQEDIKIRALIEAKNEAQQMIETTQTFINKHQTLLYEQEKTQTQQALDALKQALNANNKDLIQQQTQNLDAITQPFAQRIMNIVIADTMKGKKI